LLHTLSPCTPTGCFEWHALSKCSWHMMRHKAVSNQLSLQSVTDSEQHHDVV